MSRRHGGPALDRQQQALQDGFAAELAKAREAVEAANERAAGAERRALKEIEQERQARARADMASEALREKLGEAEVRERQQALAHAEATTRLQIELNAARAALQDAQKAHGGLERQVAELRGLLAESQQAAAPLPGRSPDPARTGGAPDAATGSGARGSASGWAKRPQEGEQARALSSCEGDQTPQVKGA